MAYFIKKKDTLFKIIKYLKEDYSITIKARHHDILDRYTALKRFPKNEDLTV